MWIFMFVGAIPFVVVFSIIVIKIIQASANYAKTKEALFDFLPQNKEQVEKHEICAYCGKKYAGNVCLSCGAGHTKK